MAGMPPSGPSDRAQRDLLVNVLDRNMIVEAAAGTGKTTGMVARMVALLRTGACGDVRKLAAVTFTRKASAELRDRFRLSLEKAALEAVADEKRRLDEALRSIDQCFVGTIHSFCGRLLRERPIEAGVDLDFEELDEDADFRLREEAWTAYCESVIGLGLDGVLRTLDDLDLDLGELWETFARFAEYPDVEEWPLPEPRDILEDLAGAEKALGRLVARMKSIQDRLPAECGTDSLMRRYARIPRVVSHYEDLSDRASMMELLDFFFDRSSGAVLKEWVAKGGFSEDEARAERGAWEEFRSEVAAPLVEAWKEFRYPAVIRVMEEARGVYDRMRRERGQLNFQDLLMKAAALLGGNPHVREYFAGRYSHLLVDEFQDTDPIQAEVMLLLTATDTGRDDWRECVPRPGSLFVVGDPKQSIYRFRRADIVTYNRVKRIILEGDGAENRGVEVTLSTNFRTCAPIIEWVNGVFEPQGECRDRSGNLVRFPAEPTEQSPAYVELEAGRRETLDGAMQGVLRLEIPADTVLLASHLKPDGEPTLQEALALTRGFSPRELAASYEADLIARFIRRALDTGMTVPRSEKEVDEIRRRRPGGEDPAAAGPEDFLIITRNKTHLSVYGRALQRYGVPHRVTGGTALNEVAELRLLLKCLRAVDRPDDPVALVGALRSELFGLSDSALYRFRRNGGSFNFNAPVPEGLPEQDAEAFSDAFTRLRAYRAWTMSMPPIAAFENVVSDLGLPVLAGMRNGGDVQAGSLGKALELLRADQRGHWSTTHLVDFLQGLVDVEFNYDGISASSHEIGAVRVMNLHKVKGLESAVVFLADTSGEPRADPEVFIDRGGDRTAGYMGVYGPKWGEWFKPLLAAPEGWKAGQAVEKEFETAERLRLRYVAATRAGSAIVVSQREDNRANGSNPWRRFKGSLSGCERLPDPGDVRPPPGTDLEISAAAVETARGEIDARLRNALGPTYARVAAKEFALRGGPGERGMERAAHGEYGPPVLATETGDTDPRLSDGAGDGPGVGPTSRAEHGVAWGTAMHVLLELAMNNPGFDPGPWAAGVLVENELDPGEADRAIETVRSVMGSEIWRRAAASTCRLTEVPFRMLLDGASVPTVISGAIDLVFLEDGGWVIVDYKTDRITPERDEAALAAEYQPQLERYSKAWVECTGEAVRETGLYFVSSGRYFALA